MYNVFIHEKDNKIKKNQVEIIKHNIQIEEKRLSIMLFNISEHMNENVEKYNNRVRNFVYDVFTSFINFR